MHLNNLKPRVPWTLILTDYQAKYIAHELPRRFPPDSVEKLTAALVDAQVDLNPHQTDAALFAFESPLAETLICQSCGTLATRRPSGSFWQCTCGNLELYPLVCPGADPRTADDET